MTREAIILRQGLIVDGSGAPGFVADLTVQGERIAAIGEATEAPGATVIDARGKVLCPGFLDV
ncbi:MAG: D-aminoacylase, partial [Anaerolineae bacterium]|nr:D-aminoacylase [Anaerolineae bacterium]